MNNKSLGIFCKLDYKYITIISIFSFLYVFPIINSQVYYIDDLGRILTGRDWSHDVRTAAGIAHKLFALSDSVINFYPYSTILSAFLLIFCLYFIGIEVLEISKNKAMLAAILSLCSPFFLENLTYRYDALPMTLSLIIPLIPFFTISRKGAFLLLSILSIFISLSFFQVGSLSYFSFFIIYIYKQIISREWYEIKKLIPLLVLVILSYLIGYFLYKHLHQFLGYNFPDRGTIILSFKEISLYYERWKTFKNSLLYGLNKEIIFAFIFFSIIIFSFKAKENISYIIEGLVFFIFILLLVFIVSLPNLFIEKPWWNSRTKINYIFVLYFYFLFVGSLSASSKFFKLIFKLICTLSLVNSLFLVSAYGQSLSNHQRFSNYLANNISNYILSKKYKNLVIIGKIPMAPQNKILHKEYPILNSISPRYERQGWVWGVRNFTPFRPMHWPKRRTEIENNYCDYKVIYENFYLKVRDFKDILILDFTSKDC